MRLSFSRQVLALSYLHSEFLPHRSLGHLILGLVVISERGSQHSGDVSSKMPCPPGSHPGLLPFH